MRRVVLSLLMLLLPLQWSVAAMAEYCLHEETPAAQQHAGHHEHEHEAAAGIDGQDQGSKIFDADCASCLAHSAYVSPVGMATASVNAREDRSSAYFALIPDPPPASLFRPPLATLA